MPGTASRELLDAYRNQKAAEFAALVADAGFQLYRLATVGTAAGVAVTFHDVTRLTFPQPDSPAGTGTIDFPATTPLPTVAAVARAMQVQANTDPSLVLRVTDNTMSVTIEPEDPLGDQLAAVHLEFHADTVWMRTEHRDGPTDRSRVWGPAPVNECSGGMADDGAKGHDGDPDGGHGQDHRETTVYVVIWSGGYDTPSVLVTTDRSKAEEMHATWAGLVNVDAGDALMFLRFNPTSGALAPA